MERKDLLNKVLNINNQDESKPLNYSFLEAIFPSIENCDLELLTEINQANFALDVDVTGYYYNEDENLITIYFSVFDMDLKNDEIISEDLLANVYKKMENLITISKNRDYKELNEYSLLFDLCDNISKNKDNEIILVLVTNYCVPYSMNTDMNYDVSGVQIGRRIHDINHILDKLGSVESSDISLDLLEKFGDTINALLISTSKDLDVYLTSIPGEWLAKLYKEDNVRLLSANVRSYLKKTNKVNKEIIGTVKEAPEEFVAYNNGISAICTNLTSNEVFRNMKIINSIENFQIVNGGQTTASLYECMNDRISISNVLVPVKLSVIKNENSLEELTSNISTYSNLQSAIKKSDPPSNNQFFKNMEEMSINIWANKDNDRYHCFFERTAGQYNTFLRMYYKKTDTFKLNNPEKKKFNKIQMAQAIMSWEQLPYMVCSGQEKNFAHFFNVIKDLSEFVNEGYFKSTYALILLYRELDTIIRKQKLLYKSNVITYSIALLSKYTDKGLNLSKIWDEQSIDKNTQILLTDLVRTVYYKLIDSPVEYSDIRMWARKKECWENILTLKLEYNFNIVNTNIDFFPVRNEKIFIENEENLKNSTLWKILNLWADKNEVLSSRQKKYIKGLPTIIYKGTMTKKQAEYAKDLFMLCVKSGFNYEEIDDVNNY